MAPKTTDGRRRSPTSSARYEGASQPCVQSHSRVPGLPPCAGIMQVTALTEEKEMLMMESVEDGLKSGLRILENRNETIRELCDENARLRQQLGLEEQVQAGGMTSIAGHQA
jgi:hypothetical protein